jgi:translation initiation factor IF-3
LSSEVRLIDENGKQCGVVKIEKALEMANVASLDLVEIAANAKPPVCKILNFGKYRYDKERQHKINKKKQHVVNVKEIRLRPNTDKHDLVIKINKAQKFLLKGDKLKITVMFRGREFLRKEAGYNLLNDIKDVLSEISVVDKEPNMQGRRLSLILSPK